MELLQSPAHVCRKPNPRASSSQQALWCAWQSSPHTFTCLLFTSLRTVGSLADRLTIRRTPTPLVYMLHYTQATFLTCLDPRGLGSSPSGESSTERQASTSCTLLTASQWCCQTQPQSHASPAGQVRVVWCLSSSSSAAAAAAASPELCAPEVTWCTHVAHTHTTVSLVLITRTHTHLPPPPSPLRPPHTTGPGPYLPKPHALYEVLEVSTQPQRPNIVTSEDSTANGGYWHAIRQATAPCFSMSNLKQVRCVCVC